MAEQIFSTVQIEVGKWRYLPVSCVDNSGDGVGGILDTEIVVTYIRYGELGFSTYVPDNVDTTLALPAAPLDTTITLVDSSNFPPENGRVQILGGGGDEFLDYSFNNVNTGELTLTGGAFGTVTNIHAAGAVTGRIDWIEPGNPTHLAPGGTQLGNYLLLFPPTILSNLDLFTYRVETTGGPVLFEYFQNTVDIIPAATPATQALTAASTCVVQGWIRDPSGIAVQNSSVFARLLGTPYVVGLGATQDSVISTKTDANGYFALTLMQGLTVDVVIPNVGYRKSIVVPSTTLANLFEIV